ncbi:MAG: hypothetical protein OEZ22_05295 [Spirochaetia bacterium]|nr:hypothetical protein [Spirochaetia bacterium]
MKKIIITAFCYLCLNISYLLYANETQNLNFWLPVLEESQNIKRYYIEYARGTSSSVTSSLDLKYNNTDIHMKDVNFEPEAYSWGQSQIRFFTILFGSDEGSLIGALTEPYYALRFNYFFEKYPFLGIGIEHTHFKIFLDDLNQNIQVSGKYMGSQINQNDPIKKYFSMYSVSHGVNHIGFTASYRLMLLRKPEIPDGIIQPYVSFSMGPAIPHVEVIYLEDGIPKGNAYEYQLNFANWGLSFNAGSRFKFLNNFGTYIESKIAYSILQGMSFQGNSGEGSIGSNFFSYHFQLGLFYAL